MSELTLPENCRAGSPHPAFIKNRPLRLIFVGGLAVLLPKCVACITGYLMLATGIIDMTPELCGAVAGVAATPDWQPSVITLASFVCALWVISRNLAKSR